MRYCKRNLILGFQVPRMQQYTGHSHAHVLLQLLSCSFVLFRSESDNCSIYSDTAGSLVSESVSFIAPSDYTNTTHHNASSRINRGHYLGYFVPEDNQSIISLYLWWHIRVTMVTLLLWQQVRSNGNKK